MATERDTEGLDLDQVAIQEHGSEQSLPQADGGKSAWKVLLASQLVQAPCWGYPIAFGVIQQFLMYSDHEFQGQSTPVATVGTTLSGIIYITSPFLFYALTRWPRLRKYCSPVGLVMTVFGFVASSFVKEIWNLILLQGILVAFGSNLIISATTLNLDEWWVRRKGLAFGLMLAAKATVGAVFPLLFNTILQNYGFRTLIRIWSVIVVSSLMMVLLIFHNLVC